MKNLIQIMKKPVSKETAKMVLANQEERDDFLIYYNFFEKDGNKDIYVNWINENLNSGSNVVVEHIFELSNYIHLFSTELIILAANILKGRKKAATKLACLDYILSIKKKIAKRQFIDLNEIAIEHTQNRFVIFQAYMNLSITNVEYLIKVKRILEREKYPTLFYRCLNEIALFPPDIRKNLTTFIMKEIKIKKFDQSVIKELSKKAKEHSN